MSFPTPWSSSRALDVQPRGAVGCGSTRLPVPEAGVSAEISLLCRSHLAEQGLESLSKGSVVAHHSQEGWGFTDTWE